MSASSFLTSSGLPPVVCLMGATATGKTELAMMLYDHFPCDLISVDSALVYTGLDIGSAKPSREERVRYPHQLIDIRDPSQPYSAADFRQDALVAIENSIANGRIPVLVGGTMLYFKVLLEGISDLPTADAIVRQQILDEADEKGWPALHAELATFDAEAAERLEPNDAQRLQRAIEVYRVSGVTLSQWHAQQQEQVFPYSVLQLAVSWHQRATIHQRIEQRFEQMLVQGFLDEVRDLRARGDLQKDLPAIRAVGYRQAWEHLDGDYDEAEFFRRGVAATRQLAKRQLTWLRNWSIGGENHENIKPIYWLYRDDEAGNLCDEGVIQQDALTQVAEHCGVNFSKN